MSRIGIKPITLPEGVSLNVNAGVIEVAGPKGQLSQLLFDGFEIKQDSGVVSVIKKVENTTTQKQFGLLRTLVANMITGVSIGFSKRLQITGVGYRVAAEGSGIALSLGYSHKINFTPPAGIDLKIEGNDIIVSGYDKQLVGEVAAEIRGYRPPEPYKGKGIKYEGEHIRRKAGKAAVKG